VPCPDRESDASTTVGRGVVTLILQLRRLRYVDGTMDRSEVRRQRGPTRFTASPREDSNVGTSSPLASAITWRSPDLSVTTVER
jgi:hypothetical protein